MENKENKFKVEKTEQQWKEQLTPEQYNVMREKGTEAPFTGIYNDNFKEGVYYCASCGKELFLSDTKFDAGCGWPSFYKSVNDSNIVEQSDFSYGMVRTEVLCSNCGGHLGHLFNDGPEPTGLRYFINSSSLKFEEKKR